MRPNKDPYSGLLAYQGGIHPGDPMKHLPVVVVVFGLTTLACGGGESGSSNSSTSGEAAGGTAEAPKAEAPAAPATGLGSAAEPRSCDARQNLGYCSQLLPAYFDPSFNVTDTLAADTCKAAGTYLKTPCPTEGVVGHCLTEVEDKLFYEGAYSASSAQAECTTFAKGKWTPGA